jgi:hypothetical protein
MGQKSSLDLSAYAGHWVAVVNGRVTGFGRTAREALLASRYQRLKEEPSLIWVPLLNPDGKSNPVSNKANDPLG